jgi:DNA-binding GntR family transcriptional regulator
MVVSREMDEAPAVLGLPPVAASDPLGEQLYRVLEEAITNGDLAPGERLDERLLAEHFGVSRIPLREALRALEVGGWIEKMRPRQGMRVRPVSTSELEELSEVRQALDGECAAVAAIRRTDAQVDALRAAASASRKALRSGDRKRVVQLNSEFHRLLAQCTQNEVFVEILSMLDKRVRRFMWLVAADILSASADEHDQLVTAIAAKDSRRARSVARRHATQHGAPSQDS